MDAQRLPFVSIIMPIRNEANFIQRAIRSILNNDYPADKMEVIVADGCSDDGTWEIVDKMSVADPRVIPIENKGRIVSTGLNAGLKVSRGQIFIRIDGHAEIPRDFIKKSVTCLAQHPDAWVVGGYWNTVSSGYVGKVIAAATQSPAGVGNARHRLGNFDGWADTVAYGAHHKWILEKVGDFDEELVRNQDDEFNMRIRLAGGKIWISSDIVSTYYSRSSMKKLWRQFFQYGFWRIRTLQKHGKPAAFRQIIPLLFVCSLVVLALAGLVSEIFWWILAGTLGLYALGLLYGTIHVGKQAGWRYSLLAPLVFAILHFAYGLGSLWGIVRFVVLHGKWRAKPAEIKLSR